MNREECFKKIIEILSKSDFIANNDSNDGRINSTVDEKKIIDILLASELNNIITIPSKRSSSDIIFSCDEEKIYINIKTTTGSTDNIFSKIGFLISFTNLLEEELPRNISWKEFAEKLFENIQENNSDYYYLVINKITKQILIRGLKQLNCLKTNPSNYIQVNWDDEFRLEPANRTFNESFNYVSGILYKSLSKDIEGKNKVIDLFENM